MWVDPAGLVAVRRPACTYLEWFDLAGFPTWTVKL